MVLSDFLLEIDSDVIGLGSGTYTISGTALSVTLPRRVFAGQGVVLSYEPSEDLLGVHGGAVTAFNNLSVDNNTAVGVASVQVTSLPTIQMSYVTGDTIEFSITFIDEVRLIDANVPSFNFTLDGSARSASYAGGDGTETLVFNYTVAAEDLAEQAIAWPASAISLDGAIIEYVVDELVPPLETAAGNAPNQYVNSYDAEIPFIVSATAAGRTLTVEFSEDLDSVTPPLEAFALWKSRVGASGPVRSDLTAGPVVSGREVTFTLRHGLALSDTSISLEQLADESNLRFTDLGGNPAEPFTEAVSNNTVAPVCPAPVLSNRKRVWQARAEVENLVEPPDPSVPGYGYFGPDPDVNTVHGDIDYPHFTLLGQSRAVQAAHVFEYAPDEIPLWPDVTNGDMLLSLSSALTPTEIAYLRLHVCGQSFDFSEAIVTEYSSLKVYYTWKASGLDWSSLAPIDLTLSMTNALISPPVIVSTSIVAPETDVLFGPTEPIDVVLHFDSAVDVDTSNGSPTVALRLNAADTSVAATFDAGSGTSDLVFRHSLGGTVHSVTLIADSLALNGATLTAPDSGFSPRLTHHGNTLQLDVHDAPSVQFVRAPALHDGAHPFDVELHFTEEPDNLEREHMIGGMITTTAATLEDAQPMSTDSDRAWRLTVRPTALADVSLEIKALACDEPIAVCFEGEPLRAGASTTIPSVHYRVGYENFPAFHDGYTPFSIRVVISPAPRALDELAVRRSLFAISSGSLVSLARVDPNRDDEWDISIAPTGLQEIVLFPQTAFECLAPSGLCDQLIEHPDAIEIPGPPHISVARAEVDENAEPPQLEFPVDLSRAIDETLTVDYVAISGTALVGDDFAETAGTVTFAPGETRRNVIVEVYPDSIDEGDETLSLRLSNLSLDYVVFERDEASGTIRNSDPIPGMWLARFGRTIASQAIDALDTRFSQSMQAGVSGKFFGVRLDNRAETELERQEALESAVFGPDDVFSVFDDNPRTNAGSLGAERTLSLTEVLGNTSFSLSSGGGGAGGSSVSAWARGAFDSFDGVDNGVSVDGNVASAFAGADIETGRALGGLMLSHTRSDGTYAGEDGRGTIDANLTTLYPYGRYALSSRTSVWGVVGYGEGSLGLSNADGLLTHRPEIGFRMGGLGIRSLLSNPGASGFELSTKADAFVARTTSERVSGSGGNLAPTNQSVSRIRFGLDASAPMSITESSTVTPSAGIAVRHDGGDAETGMGIDVGAGLTFAAPERGLSSEFRIRSLLTHADEDFSTTSVSGSLTFDPDPRSLRGPSFSIRREGSLNGQVDADNAFGRPVAGFTDPTGEARLEAKVGYGVAISSGAYTAVPELTVGQSSQESELRIGSRFVDGALGRNFAIDVGASHREHLNGSGEREYAVGLSRRLGGTSPPGASGPAVNLRLGLSHLEGEDNGMRAGATLRARW